MNPASSVLVDHLRDVQEALLEFTARTAGDDYRTQPHSDLSPIGWHLGHTVFIENFWLQETLLDDDRTTAPTRNLYLPQNTHKATRGGNLPPKGELLDHCSRMQRDNLALLREPPAALTSNALMRDDYLVKFLLQHHAMHLETMIMVLAEQHLSRSTHDYHPEQRLEPAAVNLQPVAFAGGERCLGGNSSWCFDNELPKHSVTLRPFTLNATAASNAEFLGFMESGGYEHDEWWDAQALRWRQTLRPRAPHHWLHGRDGGWYGIDDSGGHELSAAAPVSGLSHYEARAFARYAGARLPHESEWEAAHAQTPGGGSVQANHAAWEWCGNALFPYPGFKPRPYDEYSTPWFNNGHYVLRGRSTHTPTVLHRTTLRNFYTGDKRYIFAGVRVATD